jgi:hypothetical protein
VVQRLECAQAQQRGDGIAVRLRRRRFATFGSVALVLAWG